MKNLSCRLALFALLGAAACAQAQVTVKDAWVRATVPQQQATGAFMDIQAARDSRLVSASSPLTAVVQVHEMAMVDNIMKMREVPAIELPAGKLVKLQPGGYHVMLMDLKQQVKAGDSVPITLVVEGKDGKRESVQVKAIVRPLNAANPPAAQGAHKH